MRVETETNDRSGYSLVVLGVVTIVALGLTQPVAAQVRDLSASDTTFNPDGSGTDHGNIGGTLAPPPTTQDKKSDVVPYHRSQAPPPPPGDPAAVDDSLPLTQPAGFRLTDFTNPGDPLIHPLISPGLAPGSLVDVFGESVRDAAIHNQITVIPEPTTAVLMILTAPLVLTWRRRR